MKSVVSLLLCFVMIFTMSACSAVKEKFVLEEEGNYLKATVIRDLVSDWLLTQNN